MCSPIDPCRAGNGGCHDLVRGEGAPSPGEVLGGPWLQCSHFLCVSLSLVGIGIFLNPKS